MLQGAWVVVVKKVSHNIWTVPNSRFCRSDNSRSFEIDCFFLQILFLLSAYYFSKLLFFPFPKKILQFPKTFSSVHSLQCFFPLSDWHKRKDESNRFDWAQNMTNKQTKKDKGFWLKARLRHEQMAARKGHMWSNVGSLRRFILVSLNIVKLKIVFFLQFKQYV